MSGARGCGEGPEGISCLKALEVVYEYMDGELAGRSEAEVAEHFRVCSRCYPHLALETSFRDALQRARAGEAAPPELRRRLLELLEKEG